MNVENVRKLAGVIRSQKDSRIDDDDGFCMSGSHHHCGSPACINGFCEYLINQTQPELRLPGFEFITLYLEIDTSIARRLYAPFGNYYDYDAPIGQSNHITPEHAASVLYYLADTGKVEWSVRGYFPTEATADEEVSTQDPKLLCRV